MVFLPSLKCCSAVPRWLALLQMYRSKARRTTTFECSGPGYSDWIAPALRCVEFKFHAACFWFSSAQYASTGV